ncbi:hypothetical protein yc1106_01886 [Curvularia clavata]|uniref:Uncharacterized protein n=1 Tax=Curvularia clavata TaxID=95742 RepID=A0A9Q8Z2M5_CURCL|nr:hypothetical protein yc1106_01886 [Curvularia clavata]
MSITGSLTKAPKFPFGLHTERILEITGHDEDVITDEVNEPEQVVAGFGFFDSISDAVTGAVNTAVKAAVGVNPGIGTLIDINQIIKAVQGAGLAQVITPEQAAMLGINSSQFYSIVGGAVGVTAPPVEQTVAQAVKINKEFPSLWFVNFPRHMESQQVAMVHRFRQNMTDFRSWSSQKWWEEVARRDGVPDDMFQRARQSKLFAQIACEDMCKMSWLRTTKPPVDITRSIRCTAGMLHENIVSQIMSDWGGVDHDVVDAVEPLLQGIVRSARAGASPEEAGELKVVILEKYEWDANAQSVTSYIRLISFELSEAFHKVVSNKNDPMSQIQGNRRAAAVYNVAETTLRRRRAGKLARRDCQPNSKKLTKLEEEVIFKLIEQTKAKYSIYNENVYNFNEAGFSIGKITTQLVVTASERRGRPKAIQPGGRE